MPRSSLSLFERSVATFAACAFVLQISPAHAAPAARDITAPRVLHEVVRTAALGANLDFVVRFEDQSQIFEPKLYFRRVGEEQYNAIDLIARRDGTWLATIPAALVTRDLEYFLEAFDVFGNGPAWHGTQDHPHFVKVVQATQAGAQPPRQIEAQGTRSAAGPMTTGDVAPPAVAKESSGGIATKWWFWTILVVAAGGITVGVLCATQTGICVPAQSGGTFNQATIRIVNGPDPRDGL